MAWQHTYIHSFWKHFTWKKSDLIFQKELLYLLPIFYFLQFTNESNLTDTYFHSTTTLSLFLSKRNSIHIYKTFPAGKNISYLLDSDGIWAKLSWKKSLKKEVVHCYRFLNNTSLFICQFQNENWVVLTRIFLFFTADVVGNYIISTENTAHTKFLSFTAARDYNSPTHFTSVN